MRQADENVSVLAANELNHGLRILSRLPPQPLKVPKYLHSEGKRFHVRNLLKYNILSRLAAPKNTKHGYHPTCGSKANRIQGLSPKP